MTNDAKRPLEEYRLLNDEEIKIWEAADRGTDDTNVAWRELREKLAAEVEAERLEAIRQTTCTACGQRALSTFWSACSSASARSIGGREESVSTRSCSPGPVVPQGAALQATNSEQLRATTGTRRDRLSAWHRARVSGAGCSAPPRPRAWRTVHRDRSRPSSW